MEGPRGEVGFYIVSDGTRKPYRVKMRKPSFSNFSALPEILRGLKIADLVAVMGSLDLVVPEMDVTGVTFLYDLFYRTDVVLEPGEPRRTRPGLSGDGRG